MEEVTLKIKNWWKSITVWLGGILIAVSQIPPDMVNLLHPDARDWAYTLIGVALIWDRLFNTRQAVTVTAAMKPVAADKIVVTRDSTEQAGV